jgi:hypothetical protein
MDRRFTGKLDSISEAVSNLKSDVSGLNTWRDSQQQADQLFWTQTWPAEQTRLFTYEQRLRAMEAQQASFNKLDVMEKRLEQIATKLEEAGTKKNAEDLDKRVTALEKVVVRANVIWAAVSVVGGIGLQIFLHYIGSK